MRSRKRQPEYQFDLSGGVLCLDFANTISHRFDPERRREHLNSFADVVSFAQQSKLIFPAQAKAHRLRLAQHSAKTQRSFARALELRELLFRIFSAIAEGKNAAPADLKALNHTAHQVLALRELVRSDGGYRWEWKNASDDEVLDPLLWSVVQSAVDLLTSPGLSTVRLCNAPDCDWLFLDNSRNRSRRWCDMKSCGNREKARRHYLRKHE